MTRVKVSSMILALALVATSANGIAKEKKNTTPGKSTHPSGQTNVVDTNQTLASSTTGKNKSDSPRIADNVTQSIVQDTTDPDDHVRCFFTLKQLMRLQPNPSVAKLTEADQSQVLTDVVHSIDTASDKELSHQQKAEFIHMLTGDLDGKLVGKTPGEALATILDLLYQIQENDRTLLAIASNQAQLQEKAIADAGSAGDECSNAVKSELDAKKSEWSASGDPAKTLNAVAAVVLHASQTDGESCKAAATRNAAAYSRAGSGPDNELSGSVANSARNSINKLAPPPDIGCAYQILDWKTSSYLFGRSVADNYIGVQVTVRNLNPKEEFIVHNAMLKVDSDIHGAIGPYYEGVDKIGIEAFNNAGESLTPRGIVGNAIAAASTALSVLQPIVNVTNFGNAVSAFTGAVVPGWKQMSPDHQKDQLLLIANSGFSATYTTKTVVGKSGAATFYTWYPVKPLLQGWWLQNCAQNMATVGSTPDDDDNPPELGVDLKRARNECKDAKTPEGPAKLHGKGVSKDDWRTIPYKQWSPISDQLFRDLSQAVVAGIHVREESKNKSSVTDLKCPTNDKGDVDLSKASTYGSISCDVTGDNLDRVAKMRLENAANAVDPVRPEATVTVSGDNTTAKATFKVSDLASAPGSAYNVYSVGKDGAEAATGLNLNLDSTDAKITGIDPETVDLGSLPASITLNGYNLDPTRQQQPVQLCITNSASSPAATLMAPIVKGASRTQATVSLEAAGLKDLGKGDWNVKACSDKDSSKLTLKVTGARTAVFTPLSGAPGATVTVTAPNFSGTPSVTFNGASATVLQVKDQTITVKVPADATTGQIRVTNTANYEAASKESFTVLSKAAKKPIRKDGKTAH